jgi:hypothetical protein
MNTPLIIVVAVAVILVGFFAWRRFESLSGKTTEELRAISQGSDWLFYRKALRELRKRGEDIKPEVMPILNLLISDSKHQRIGGWLILKVLYPELASRVTDYKPQDAPDVCKGKMQKIFLSQ